jgi:hypothetical protein
MNDFMVVFSENGGKVIKGIDPTQVPKNALLNPSLEAVKTTPPHLWVRVGDKVMPLNLAPSLPIRRVINARYYLIPLATFLLGVLCTMLLMK